MSAGKAIGAPTGFHLGVSVNPSAPNLDEELAALRVQGRGGRRVRRHAPVFDHGVFERS